MLFSYDLEGRTRKMAIFAADDVRDWNRDEGWGVRAWAPCDPSEFPSDIADDLNIGAWEDESGRRVPVTSIQSFQGAEHCSWTECSNPSCSTDPGYTSVRMRCNDDQQTPPQDRVTAFKLTYERRVAERDRIREARSFFARQLGPLPTFAGISLAAVGVFSEELANRDWLSVALGVFCVMVATSIAYSRMPAYRELRSHQVDTVKLGEGQDTDNPQAWYQAESKLEASIYASEEGRARWWRRPTRNLAGTLQEQLDKERFGLFIVQLLFLAVIACLLFARIGSPL